MTGLPPRRMNCLGRLLPKREPEPEARMTAMFFLLTLIPFISSFVPFIFRTTLCDNTSQIWAHAQAWIGHTKSTNTRQPQGSRIRSSPYEPWHLLQQNGLFQ